MNAWLWTELARAASVTVSPGDDLNSVTSSLQPGDVVTFNPGTYQLDESVSWTGQGTAEKPILFRAAGGTPVVLQNQGGGYVAYLQDSAYVTLSGITFEGVDPEENEPSGLYISDSTHITVEDCTIRNVWYTGLRIDGNTSNITISHNEISSSGDGSGINVGCGDASCWMQDSLIELNLLHDLQGTGIYLQPGTQSTEVRHNVIFRVNDDGIVANDTAFGPQNLIEGNAIWETEDTGIYVTGPALIRNNILFEIGNYGIRTRSNYDSLFDVQISHNTIARTDGWGAYLEHWYDREGMVFSNNAIANPTGYGLYWDDWRYEDGYSSYSTTTTVDDTPNYITNNVVTGLVDGFTLINRPDFVIPGGGVSDFVSIDDIDFYPTAGSLLRDAADSDGNAYIPPEDFNGTGRDGAAPDAGAYEYDGDGNPGWLIQEGFKDYSPRDSRNVTGASGGCCGKKKAEETEALLLLPLLGLWWRRRRPAR